MPFAWYCVSMAKIFETKLKDNRDAEVIPPLDAFFHCTVKLQCLIVQDSDRMKDEDLIRYCVELKKYEAGARTRPKTNFEYIRADIAIEVSTIVENDLICVYSSTYNRIKGKEVKKRFRPVREIEEYPAKEIYKPYVSYKNLLYIYPQSLNLMKAGTTHWRNIAVRITYLTSEDHDSALNIIYGKSNSPKFLNETWTNVTYHNRTPDFYDEIKIDLPANISEFSHLLFQFYHITCQKKAKKEDETELTQFVGVTWLPIININTGRVNAGEIFLPISSEPLPRDYSRADPDIALPSIKWMDNHRPLFKVDIHLVSSFHPQCSKIHNYLTTAFWADKLEIEPTPTESTAVIKQLKYSDTENLVRFAHIILDSLFKFLVVEGQVSVESFNALAQIIDRIHQTLLYDEEPTGRNRTLAAYVHYVFRSPDPFQMDPKSSGRYLHEVLIELWQRSRNEINECVNSRAWFYFEIIVKSMIQTLYKTGKNNTQQSERFSEEFYSNLLGLVENLILLIVSKVNSNNIPWAHHLSQSLAYFISDCFTVINRTHVLKMIYAYFSRLCQANIECNAYIQLRIDFLHVICMHEYFVQMNLPIPEWWISRLETQMYDDLSINVYSWDGEPPYTIPSFIELSTDFMQHHYLVGCLLSTVSYVLLQKQFPIKSKLISLLRDLLEAHDADIRYEKIKSYIAYLYLPLVGIAMECIPILYTTPANMDEAPRNDSHSAPYNLTQLQTRTSVLIHAPRDTEGKDTRCLEPQTTKDLLFCFLWVMKNVDFSLKHHLFISLKPEKLETLLHLLDICLDTFEYLGIDSIRTSTYHIQPTDTIKQDLESMIVGQNSAVQRLRMIHAGGKVDQDNEIQDRRWRLSSRANTTVNPNTSKENDKLVRIDAQINCNLSVEVSLIILDLIEALIREDIQDDDLNFNSNELKFRVTSEIPSILQLFLHFLTTNQCTYVISCVCSSLRSLIYKYPEFILFHFQEQCSALCQNLLKHCSSNLSEIRMEATGTLYALMRRHFLLAGTFAYVKVQITSALSSIVGEMVDKTESTHDVYLRCSLNTLTKYAKSNQSNEHYDSTFPSQVESLSENLLHVINDTAKLRACGCDSEMRLDLMYSIAKSYQNSPDLRIAWLENMMTKNKEEGNNSEAGMCLIHIAAIISEYLGRIDPKPFMPIGAVSFQKISPNVIEESAVSEDTVSAKEEGVCNSNKFSEEGIQGMLKLAREAFTSAQLYEAVVEIDKVLIPILEHKRAYTNLSRTHENIQHCYRYMEGGSNNRRYFASYYRVGFYGDQFENKGGNQFIYKCNTICKLSEFKCQMETVMRQKYGDIVKFIQDGGKVDKSTLLPGYVYVQVTYVEPYFDEWEQRDRQTEMERSFNVDRFSFLTPFTKDGRSHGNPPDQYARLTIFTTYNTFPYLKARVSIMCEEEIELSPIEMAIEEIRKRTQVIESILDYKPTDLVMLDMRISGAIAPTVNQGPIAIARAFLGLHSKSELTDDERWLRVQFRDFIRINEKGLIALKENSNQGGMKKEYLRNLDKNFHSLKEELKPLLDSGNKKGGRKQKKKKEGQIFNRISGVGSNLRVSDPNATNSST